MPLINYNYTRLKCTDCGKLFEIRPGQEIKEVVIRCNCKQEDEPKKRVRKKDDAA